VSQTEVSVVIPHFNGWEILDSCLNSLQANDLTSTEILVIDNGSSDGSQQKMQEKYPFVRLVQNAENRGYAGGCNDGIKLSTGRFVLLLNNDTEVADNFITVLHSAIIRDEKIAIVQPKLLSIYQKNTFDYSGAAGGEIDIFGYPFARGRVFEDIEIDNGQYDQAAKQIFWASGTACLIRRSVLDEIGLLDEDFFAHMEEIDLNWRAQLAGYRVEICMDTFLYHYSGYTLQAGNPRKLYLNHRNNLVMLMKNYSAARLLWLLPARLGLEIITALQAVLRGNFKWAAAVARAMGYFIIHLPALLLKHRQIQKLRKIPDSALVKRMYPGSVALAHFLLKQGSREINSDKSGKK
jgi:GT2 family glycosyltransferase